MIGPFSHVLMPGTSNFAAWAILGATLLAGGAVDQSLAEAQPPVAETTSPSPNGPPPVGGQPAVDRSAPGQPDVVLTDPASGAQLSGERLTERVDELVASLRSDQFAERELACEQLFQIGHDVLPMLRSRRKQIADPEQSDRLNRIIEFLSKQDLESRIRTFLRGGSTDLENWPELEKRFGDSPRVRELFVDLYREHPYLVKALGGSPQELAVSLSLVRRRIGERNALQQESPNRLDLLALLLPMIEPKFQAEPQYDMLVASLLESYPANELRGDVVFGVPFMQMIETWMAKSDITSRASVLQLALQWKLKVGLELAIQSLNPPFNPLIVCRAMQVISKQGNREHAPLLLPFLNDPTIMIRRRYALGPRGGNVQVGDIAAAAIAALHSVPVTKIGFAEPAEHDVFGIIFDELIVPMKPFPKPLPAQGDADQETTEDTEAPPQPPLLLRDRLGRRVYSPEELDLIRQQQERRDETRVQIQDRARILITGTEAQPKMKTPDAPDSPADGAGPAAGPGS